ncbi:MAG: methionyl-tRNA formyltransferase [Phycisphaerae bacterium]
MRLIFCGSGTFAVPTLRALAESQHELACVITQPPRPAGRSRKCRPTPLADAAAEMDLDLCEFEDINSPDAVDRMQSAGADAICVVDYGQFIARQVRELTPRGAFNLHASLLPEMRGAAPINWAIIRGYKRTGVTTFKIVREMDAGPVYLQRATDIEPHETAEELRDRLAPMGAEVVLETIGLLTGDWAEATEQDHSSATYAPRLKKSDGVIDFSADAASIRNLIHGAWPWPGGQAEFQGRHKGRIRVVLARASVAEGGTPDDQPGAVCEDLSVATGGGRLAIHAIKPAGGRLMQWRDFVNGYRVQSGDRFEALT